VALRAGVLAVLAVLLAPAAAVAQTRYIGYSTEQEPPHCGPRICVHHVATTADAPPQADADADEVPDYVEDTLAAWEQAYDYEVGLLGWAPPPSDGDRGGGEDLVDVYLKQLGGTGYASYDVDLASEGYRRAPGYAVVDQDFAEYNPSLRLALIRGVGAHELNHVLQYGTDARQELWFLEASATTTEEPFAPGLNSWVSYARRWGQTTEMPIDAYDHAKGYGTGSFLMWLQAQHGEDAIADAWRRSQAADSRAAAALDATIRDRGGDGFAASLVAFAAEAAEWRRPAMKLPDRALLTDVERVATLTDGGAGQAVKLDGATLALLDVPPPPAAEAADLTVRIPDGVNGGLALVGRTGEADTGEAVIRMTHLPQGGAATVTLEQPARFTRITAVLVNADQLADGATLSADLRLRGVPEDAPPLAPEPPPEQAPAPIDPAGGELPLLREPSRSRALSSVVVARRVRRATALRGLPLRVDLAQPATLEIEVRAGRRVLARATRAVAGAGRRTIRVPLRRRALPPRRAVLTIVVRARDRLGAVSTERRRAVLVR
jgi:hypothetical protein